ncbi:MAG: bifunctional riboflavin kinase/FAD synthetase [Candidatus Omnitrophota bacterium]
MRKTSGRREISKAIVSIGIFDGIHLGHQRILRELIRESRRQKARSAVITFDPHPRKVLNPGANVPLLISLKHRLKLIKEMGVDSCLVLRFTRSFSKISPGHFIKDVLLKNMDLKALVIGENFLFGAGKKGGPRLLKELGGRHGFKLVIVKPAKVKGNCVSSTSIRQAIKKGELRLASLMLGRPVTVLGTVIKGRGLGRRLGFPTANINPHHESIPPSGVYAVDAMIGDKFYKGALNIGTRPTIGRGTDPSIEIHVINFKKNIYGEDIEIIFKKKLRSEKKFKSLQDLKDQIAKDILLAKKI